MHFGEKDIQDRLIAGEDSHWEFKQLVFSGNRLKAPTRNKLANEIVAFANADGGNLLCGVDDQGNLQGLTPAQMDDCMRILEDLSQNGIKPQIELDIDRIKVSGKRLLHVQVPEGYAKHESLDGCYRRVGTSAARLNSDAALRLAPKRAQSRFLWFDKQIVPNTGLLSLDEEKWKPLLSVEGKRDPDTALEKMGVLGSDENDTQRATVAGVLLYSRKPEELFPNAVIAAACYSGADRSTRQYSATTIGGSLDEQIRQAQDFAVRNMNVAARKEPGRINMPQYSARAIFEALVNAVVHRDYSIQGSRIRLSVFSDRIEIASPGSLPNNLTVDAMGSRQATRNETLASLLGTMPIGDMKDVGEREFFIEKRGDGVPIILRETRKLCGKLPTYTLINDAELQLTIPAAANDFNGATIAVLVFADGKPLPGADVMVLFPNNTWRQAKTDDEGLAEVDLYTTSLPMTVFAACEGYSAGLEEQWIPKDRNLAMNLRSLPQGGSAIWGSKGGSIPNLRGRISPSRDYLDRTYVYASNMVINKGKPQPVSFEFGEELSVTDIDGNNALINFVCVIGNSTLVEYKRS